MHKPSRKNCLKPTDVVIAYPCCCERKLKTQIPKIKATQSQNDYNRELKELYNTTVNLRKKEQEFRKKTEELRKVIDQFEARKREQDAATENIKNDFSKLRDDVKKAQQNCKRKCPNNNICSRCNTEDNKVVKEKTKKNKQSLRKEVYNKIIEMHIKPRLYERLNCILQPKPLWSNSHWLRRMIPSPDPCVVQGLSCLRDPCVFNVKTDKRSMQAGDCKAETTQCQQMPYDVLTRSLLFFAVTFACLPCLCCAALAKCCFFMCCNDF